MSGNSIYMVNLTDDNNLKPGKAETEDCYLVMSTLEKSLVTTR
jgi:hypothetical protein